MSRSKVIVGGLVALLTISALGSAVAAPSTTKAQKKVIAKQLELVKGLQAKEKLIVATLKENKVKEVQLQKIIDSSTDATAVAKAKAKLAGVLNENVQLQIDVKKAKSSLVKEEKVLVKEERIIDKTPTPVF